jgi:hypothetical protein
MQQLVSSTLAGQAAWSDGPAQASLLDWDSHGCQVNAVTLDDLLAMYSVAGFLDAANPAHLASMLPAVEDTWERMLSAGQDLRRVITFRSLDGGRWGSVDTWRSCIGTWDVQHLATNGGGVGSRACVVTAVGRCLADPTFIAAESFFRPSNPFSRRVLGGSALALGQEDAVCWDLGWFGLDPGRLGDGPRAGEVNTITADVHNLLLRGRGPIYLLSSGVVDDPQLKAIGALYCRVGLRRSRRIWVERNSQGRCVGVALAHRGPLGLNLSYTENRCDLVLEPNLAPEHATEVAAHLVRAAADGYDDFAPELIPLTIALSAGHAIAELGGGPVQPGVVGGHSTEACHISWSGPGLPRLASYFDRVIRPGGHRALAALSPADDGNAIAIAAGPSPR